MLESSLNSASVPEHPFNKAFKKWYNVSLAVVENNTLQIVTEQNIVSKGRGNDLCMSNQSTAVVQ